MICLTGLHSCQMYLGDGFASNLSGDPSNREATFLLLYPQCASLSTECSITKPMIRVPSQNSCTVLTGCFLLRIEDVLP